MKADTKPPSRMLPTRIPRFQPGLAPQVAFDSESALYSMSSAVMKRPLGRPNWVHVAMYSPSWSKIWRRALPRSPTYSRPWESMANAWGSRNSPEACPVLPQALMNDPFGASLTMRLFPREP